MLEILFQDEHLVAVHKPSGLLVHRSALSRGEREFALQMLRDQLGRHVHPVHRLDRATSGVLLFALDREVASRLAGMLARGEVEKTYLAVVRGHPPEQGEIDHPLVREPDEYEDASEVSQPARTRFRRLDIVELPHRVDRYPTSRYALVELQPRTGRRHQLRRHLAHLRHPIVGDVNHGVGKHNRLFRKLFGCHRLLLCCVELRLAHPVTGATLRLTAPPEESFASVLRELGWAAER
jgi:tRNA pseudouridine65 synthase